MSRDMGRVATNRRHLRHVMSCRRHVGDICNIAQRHRALSTQGHYSSFRHASRPTDAGHRGLQTRHPRLHYSRRRRPFAPFTCYPPRRRRQNHCKRRDAACSKGARGRNTSRRGEQISSKGDDDAFASATTPPFDRLHNHARRSRRRRRASLPL